MSPFAAAKSDMLEEPTKPVMGGADRPKKYYNGAATSIAALAREETCTGGHTIAG